MKRRWLLYLALALTLSACASPPPTLTPTPTETATPVLTPTPSITPTRPVTPWPTITPRPVLREWIGQIYSAGGAQYDDYIRLINESPALEYGIASANPEVEAQVVALRDTERLVQVVGALACGIADFGGCRIEASRVYDLDAGILPPKLEEWRGMVESAEPESGFDDCFRLADNPDHAYGLTSTDPNIAAQLESYRDTGTVLRVQGGLTCPAEDYGNCQLDVAALEVDRLPTPAPALEAFVGVLARAEPPYDDYLSVGPERYGVAAADAALQAQLEAFREAGAMVQVIGALKCPADDVGRCQIQAVRADSFMSETPVPRFEWFEGTIHAADAETGGDATLVIDDGFAGQTFPLVADTEQAASALVASALATARDSGAAAHVAGWIQCPVLSEEPCRIVALYVEASGGE